MAAGLSLIRGGSDGMFPESTVSSQTEVDHTPRNLATKGDGVKLDLGSNLCDKCSVLRFEDKCIDGYEAEDEDGHRYLKSNDDDKMMRFWLDYQHTDLLPDLPRLKASAEAGCVFCGQVRDAALKLALKKGHSAAFRMFYVWRPEYQKYGLTSLGIHIGVDVDERRLMDENWYDEGLVFLVDCEEGACKQWLRTPLSPRAQTLCDENVARIKEELGHYTFKSASTTNGRFLPARLIDVGDEGSSIHLIQTSERPTEQSNHYAALSYCWGTKEEAACQLRTMSYNLQQHLLDIPVDNMTLVMKDMVKTARSLSIRYVWIDALCIIQDDVDDWSRESERMGLIYANAFATICALSTSSCLESFLHRNSAVRVPFCSGVRADMHGMLNLRYQPLRSDLIDTKRAYGLSFEVLDYLSGTWDHRAWTYQEVQLSPRVVKFGVSRIYIECEDRVWTEPEKLQWLSEDRYSSFPWGLDIYRRTGDSQRFLNEWYGCANSYSSRQISDERDRLPALSGLAKLMAEATGDEYLAGLWKKGLLQGLLWIRSMPPNKSDLERLSPSLEQTYVGPSWSWINGYNDFQFFSSGKPKLLGNNAAYEMEMDLLSECQSIQAICTPEAPNLNPYGRITAGKLIVSGKLIRPCKEWTWTNFKWKVTYDGYRALCDVDWPLPEGARFMEVDDVCLLLIASSYGTQPSYDFCDEPVGEEPDLTDHDDNDQLTGERAGDYEISSNRNAWGLILRPIDNGARLIRVGRFRSGARQGGLLLFANRPFEEVEVT